MWIIKIGVAVSIMLRAKYFEISEEGLMKYHYILKWTETFKSKFKSYNLEIRLY